MGHRHRSRHPTRCHRSYHHRCCRGGEKVSVSLHHFDLVFRVIAYSHSVQSSHTVITYSCYVESLRTVVM